MQIVNLEKLDKAPASGTMLIYTRDEVIFEYYSDINELKAMLNGKELLEIHLFDDFKEYRAISSESVRNPSGYIENISDFEMTDETTFIEKVLLDDRKSYLSVVNHIEYDDNGMAYFDDYRMIMGGNL